MNPMNQRPNPWKIAGIAALGIAAVILTISIVAVTRLLLIWQMSLWTGAFHPNQVGDTAALLSFIVGGIWAFGAITVTWIAVVDEIEPRSRRR
jgi:hypothetical protein